MSENSDTPTFLVIDHNRDSRFLLVKSLSRKFPRARIVEIADGEDAIQRAAKRDLTAIITHRTNEYFGTEMVEKLREANDEVPIVMVSGIERTAPALVAGADRFMLYDEWLRIGTIVQELLEKGRTPKVVVVAIDQPLPKES